MGLGGIGIGNRNLLVGNWAGAVGWGGVRRGTRGGVAVLVGAVPSGDCRGLGGEGFMEVAGRRLAWLAARMSFAAACRTSASP